MTNLEDKNFNDNVLHKIKEEKILPKPKWQFLLKNFVVWGLGVCSLVLGAISTSLIFYMITGEDSGLGHEGANNLEALFVVIPFFWIICLIVFAFAVFFYIKHTKKGYKYSAKQIIIFIIGASLLFGGLLNLLGAGRFIDDNLGERTPFYDRIINPRLDYWSNPDSGRLTGIIVSKQGPAAYDLVDRSGETWVILLPDEQDNHEIIIDHPVKLIGRRLSEHGFLVKDVLSVGPGREFLRRLLPPKVPHNCQLNTDGGPGVCNLPVININNN